MVLQIRDFREKIGRLPYNLRTSHSFVHTSKPLSSTSGRPTCVEASSFITTFLTFPKRAVHTVSSADSWQTGKAVLCFTWLAAGRPTEQMECARLLNVTPVDRAGRPMQRPTVNLSQMPWVAGSFLSHHCLLGPCVLSPAKTGTFSPKTCQELVLLSFCLFVFKQPYSLDKGHVSQGGATPKRRLQSSHPPACSKTGRLVLSCPVADALRDCSGSRAFCLGCACSMCQASSTPRTL